MSIVVRVAGKVKASRMSCTLLTLYASLHNVIMMQADRGPRERVVILKGRSFMNEETLGHVDLFSTLDKRELLALAGGCQERTYTAGSTIFTQGDAGVG